MTVTIRFNVNRYMGEIIINNVIMVETISQKLVIIYQDNNYIDNYTEIKHYPMSDIDYYIVKNE